MNCDIPGFPLKLPVSLFLPFLSSPCPPLAHSTKITDPLRELALSYPSSTSSLDGDEQTQLRWKRKEIATVQFPKTKKLHKNRCLKCPGVLCGSCGLRPGQHYPGLPFIHTTPPPPIPSFQSGDIPPWSTVDFKNGYFGPHRSNAYCLRGVGVGGGGAMSLFACFSEKCRGAQRSRQRSTMTDLRLHVASLAYRCYRF